MYSEPCARLITRVTPKMSESPAASRNRNIALLRPLKNCNRKSSTELPTVFFLRALFLPDSAGSLANLFDLLLGEEQILGPDELGIHQNPVAQRRVETGLADPYSRVPLVVEGTDRHFAHGRVQREALQGVDHLLLIGGSCFLDGLDKEERALVAEQVGGPGVLAEPGLVRAHELPAPGALLQGPGRVPAMVVALGGVAPQDDPVPLTPPGRGYGQHALVEPEGFALLVEAGVLGQGSVQDLGAGLKDSGNIWAVVALAELG